MPLRQEQVAGVLAADVMYSCGCARVPLSPTHSCWAHCQGPAQYRGQANRGRVQLIFFKAVLLWEILHVTASLWLNFSLVWIWLHCCWFEAVWAEQVTRQSNYTCSRLYFGHYHLPPYSCTVLYFVFYGYYPLPELLGQKLHLCIISILYLFSFLYFGHYLPSL